MSKTQLTVFAFTVLTAAAADIHSWLQSSKEAGRALPFNWGKAAVQWVIGALTGGLGGQFIGGGA